jgi:DNA-binding XRE family transcriptional regulator
LIAGDKPGRWRRWYAEEIPRAEHVYEIYLKERAEEEAGGMSGYVKWDRAAYVNRIGGIETAERRRKAVMARQSGYQLAEERKRHGLTQAQLAAEMGVSPGRVSQVERGELATIEAVARYIEALGGQLDLVARFSDHTVTVATTEAA